MSTAQLIAASLAVVCGALVQSGVGLGMNLICVPAFLLIEPGLVPGPALVIGSLGAAAVALRCRQGVDFRATGLATVGRIPGTALGLLAIAVVSARPRVILVAAMVLLGCLLSAVGRHVRPRSSTILGAGFLSGAMGVTAALGGPPLALLYQRERLEEIRAQLAGFAFLSGCMSLVALLIVGRFGTTDVERSVQLLPALMVGTALSTLTASMFANRARMTLVGLSAAAALVVMLEQLSSS